MHAPTHVMSPSGPTVSRITAGAMNLAAWQLAPQKRLAWIQGCLDLGITTFDHADIYGGYSCEALFGEALALQPALRQNMQLVSKCGIRLVSPNRPTNTIKHYDTGRNYIVTSAEASLRNLQTDYLDLLLIHRPDPLMDADEVADAFIALHRDGKVRFFGVSNFQPAQVDLLSSRLPFALVTNQIEFSALATAALTDGTLDQCQQRRIAPMAWSPLAGGRIFRPQTPQEQRLQQTLAAMGAARGAGVDQVALAWIMSHPARVVPVLGTGRLDRLAAAAAAVQIALSRQEWFEIWEAAHGREVP